MLQKTYGKFEFLSNNCSAKKGVFLRRIIQALSRQFKKKLIAVAELKILSVISLAISVQKCIHSQK
jgi:hypothetical protein